jgi:hypothetical protein
VASLRDVWLLLRVERWREDQVTLQEMYNTKVMTFKRKKNRHFILYHSLTDACVEKLYLIITIIFRTL